jgi:hypothetical protein
LAEDAEWADLAVLQFAALCCDELFWRLVMSLPRLLRKSLPSLMRQRANDQKALREAASEISDREVRRELTTEERSLLSFVLAKGDEAAQTYQHQVVSARVVSRCGCGCPTIGLEVDRSLIPGSTTGRVIVDLLGQTPDGGQVGLLVFADGGFLSELEIYELDPHEKPYPLPTLDSLHPFEITSNK